MRATASDGSRGSPEQPMSLTTGDLLRRAQQGDPGAGEQLLARYFPRLRRWAAGRLPLHARGLFDTMDLVQETLMKVWQGLDRIEFRQAGSFQAYVRSALQNRICDEVRWARRWRDGESQVPEDLTDRIASPLENAIGAEILGRYERALAELDPADQELLHLRIELAFEHSEIAVMTGKPSADAARVAFQRALARLAEGMDYAR